MFSSENAWILTNCFSSVLHVQWSFHTVTSISTGSVAVGRQFRQGYYKAFSKRYESHNRSQFICLNSAEGIFFSLFGIPLHQTRKTFGT